MKFRLALISAAIILVCSCSQKSGGGLVIDSTGTSCGYKGVTVKVGVSGDVSWKAASDSSRVMIAPSVYSGNCRVSITVPPTETKQVHDIHVWFTDVSNKGSKACYTITQDAAPYLEFERDTVVVPYAGDTIFVGLASNMRWELENKIIIDSLMSNFIKMSPIEGEGDSVIRIIVPQNPRPRQRTLEPVMVMKDEPKQTDKLTIIQTKN